MGVCKHNTFFSNIFSVTIICVCCVCVCGGGSSCIAFSEWPTKRRFKPRAFEGRDQKSASSEQFPLGWDPGTLPLEIPGATAHFRLWPRPCCLFPTACQLRAATKRAGTRSSHTHARGRRKAWGGLRASVTSPHHFEIAVVAWRPCLPALQRGKETCTLQYKIRAAHALEVLS